MYKRFPQPQVTVRDTSADESGGGDLYEPWVCIRKREQFNDWQRTRTRFFPTTTTQEEFFDILPR